MFDLIKIKNFKHHWAVVGVNNNVNSFGKFVYAENQDDITDLFGILWEIGKMDSARNQIVKFVVESKKSMYPNAQILKLLKYLIKFRDRGMVDENKWRLTALGISDLSLSSFSRTSQIDSLLPHITVHDKIWINDLILEGSPTYFIEIFNVRLWFAFLVVFTVIGIMSTFGIVLLKKFAKHEIDNLNWYSILVNQGGNENSTFISRRFLIISLALVATIFHGAFGAFMSSSLAVRHPDLPFSDITSLLNSPTYTVCALPYTVAYDQLTCGARKIRHSAKINSNECPNIFRQYDSHSISIKYSEKPCPGINMAYVGQGLCFFPEMTANCPMSSIRGKYFKEYVTMIKYPGFKYYEQFNQGILRLRSSGHLDFIVRNHDLKVLHGTCAKQYIVPEPDIQVSFLQIQLLLAIMLLGFVCSTTFLLLEWIYKTKLRGYH